MNNTITKKQYKWGGKKKGIGGFLGTALGAGAGAFLGNPMLGAKLGGMAGGAIEGATAKDPRIPDSPMAYPSQGYAHGGYIPDYAKAMAFGGSWGEKGHQRLEEGGYYAIKASETSDDEPKYPINSADDVKDAWKLRNHGDYNISKEKLENRIKRKAREYDVDLNTDEKATGGSMKSLYKYGGNPFAEMYAKGGKVKPMGQDAKKVEGNSHEKGGVELDENTEVEGGETLDNVKGQGYVFSKRLKVPGTDQTFAKAHEQMVKNNADPAAIEKLAELQEKVAGRQ